MAETQTLLSFILTSFLIELTPGPNMTYLVILALSRGRLAGLQAVAGVALGLALIGFAATAGMAGLVENSPLLYGALRWGGILFLVYLAYDGWVSAGKEEEASYGREFLRGLIANILNPKAAVFFLTALPTFMDPSKDPFRQSFLLTAIYLGIATAIHLGIVLLASYVRPFLASSRASTAIRRILSAGLVVVAAWLFFTTQR